MNENWYEKTAEQLEYRFNTNRASGLSRSALSKAKKKYGPNDIYPTPIGSFFDYVRKIQPDYASLLLLVAAAVAGIFNEPIAAGAIVAMLIINYVAILFIFIKSQRVLEGMAAYSLPTAKVMRDGKLLLLEMTELLPGDLIFLSAGDVVPADCRIISCNQFKVNEGGLFDGRYLVEKSHEDIHTFGLKYDTQTNMVFATTLVSSGDARCIVVATGKNTVASEMGKVGKIVTHENLKILDVLRRYSFGWGLVMILTVFFITVLNIFRNTGNGIFSIFLTGTSLAASSMAELFPIFGYIIIGCGIFAAMQRKRDINVGTLIKNAEKLDDLRSIDMLIVPKEGMMTSTDVHAEKIYTPGKLFSATDTDRVDQFRSVVYCGVISTGIYGAGLTALNEGHRNITPDEEALIRLAESLSLYNVTIDRNYPIIEHRPVGGASRFDTTLIRDSDGGYMAVCRGEIEEILNSCSYFTQGGAIYRMTTDDRLKFLGAASSIIRSSGKIAAFATHTTASNSLRLIGPIQSEMTFEGFIALREPIQNGVAQTIKRCRDSGIKVVMTTDRYTESDKYLAMSIGLISSDADILDHRRLETMSDSMIRASIPYYSMYCGINPAGISKIIDMAHAEGRKVGLLAGGINGALLLKKADVGFARSITISPRARKKGIDIRTRRDPAYSRISRSAGTFDSEALKLISDVVVSDADENGNGGFAAVVAALEYARSINKNIYRMLRYLIYTQLSRIFLTLISIFTGNFVLTPVQLLFGGLIIDFGAIIVSAFAKPSHDILSTQKREDKTIGINRYLGELRSVLYAIFQTVTIAVIPSVCRILGFVLSAEETSAITFIAFTLCQVVTLVELADNKSIFTANLRYTNIFAVFIVSIAAFITAGILDPHIGETFGIIRLSLKPALVCAAVPVINLAMHEIYKLLTSNFASKKEKKI